MGSIESATWLEKLEERINIDVDWMDPDFIKSMSMKPHDQTSNQLWLGIQLSHPSNKSALAACAQRMREEGWLTVYTKMAALLCQKNLDLIKGRVLVQTSPSEAYNEENILDHARRYDQEFQNLGVPRSRFCIKILATGPGVNACRILQQEGIQTLGTGVFSVEQAIACSQARCLSISPYYNGVRIHENPSLWPNVADPALQHPFSNRILQMTEMFKQFYRATGQEQPLVKNAAFRSIKEVIATAELGCHSATMSPQMLDELASTRYEKSMDPGVEVLKSRNPYKSANPAPARLRSLLKTDPLKTGAFVPARADVDYLANGGAELEKALLADPIGSGRLNDAITMFIRAENASKELIEGLMERKSL